MGESRDFRVVAQTATGVGIDGTYTDPSGPSEIEWTWPYIPEVGERVRFGNSRWFRVESRDWTAPNPQDEQAASKGTLVLTITDEPE